MARDENKRWKCLECGHISLEVELLKAPNPFEETDTIVGCPECKGVEGFDDIFDEPGCDRTATCGFPVKEGFGGYRRTCGHHITSWIPKTRTVKQSGGDFSTLAAALADSGTSSGDTISIEKPS